MVETSGDPRQQLLLDGCGCEKYLDRSGLAIARNKEKSKKARAILPSHVPATMRGMRCHPQAKVRKVVRKLKREACLDHECLRNNHTDLPTCLLIHLPTDLPTPLLLDAVCDSHHFVVDINIIINEMLLVLTLLVLMLLVLTLLEKKSPTLRLTP